MIYLDRYGDFETESSDSVLIIGVGGGASVLAADACSDHGLRVPVLPDEIQARVGEKNFGGDYMGFLTNPLDLRIAPNGSPEWTNEVLDIVLPARRFSDVLVHIDVVQYFGPKPPPRSEIHFRPDWEYLGIAMVPTCGLRWWPATSVGHQAAMRTRSAGLLWRRTCHCLSDLTMRQRP